MSPSTPHQPAAPAPDAWALLLLSARDMAPGALDRLLWELRPGWLALAGRLVRDRDAAQDVVQEASVHLWRRLDRFDPAKCRRAKSWLDRLLVNRAIDHLRRRRRALPLLEYDLSAPPGEQPDQQAERRERTDRLRHQLGELPPRDREALLLRFEQGLGYKRIAAHLGVSISGAYRIVHKALRRLAHTMSEAGGRAAVA
jgi:RNA polymerase sigma-70 factor (ECF subfamily)